MEEFNESLSAYGIFLYFIVRICHSGLRQICESASQLGYRIFPFGGIILVFAVAR